MASQLLECVPNFSEGRRQEVIDAIAKAAGSASQVADLHFDPDHNRAVLTLIGSADELVASISAATAVAVEEIDLDKHSGVHPRMGAVDVVPFIPLESSGMETAVDAAIACAQAIAARGVPCFLYEHASSAARTLPEVRRGSFSLFGPDFGTPIPHPTAGAACVGARETLVAFNVNIATQDVTVAERIARRVRESSGGMPHVRAMGLHLQTAGLCQVSMNLTRPAVTTMSRVFSRVEQLARGESVEVHSSEVVGLIPEAAVGELSLEEMLVRGGVRTLEEVVNAAG